VVASEIYIYGGQSIMKNEENYMDSRYDREVAKFGKKDALIALCAVVAFSGILALAIYVLMALIPEGLTDIQSTLWNTVTRVILVAAAVVIVLLKKQGLSSIGFHKDKLLSTLKFTLLLTLIFSAFGVIPGLIFGWEFNGFGAIIPIILTTFIMAAGEDIFYVGYLQTRLHGLIKSHVLAILTGAVFFALVHVPAVLIGGYQYPADLVAALIVWILGHSFMVLIFRRHFSIIPVMVTHTLANFFSGGGLWSEFNLNDNMMYSGIFPILSVFVVLLIMEIVHWRRRSRVCRQ
jgi:membrane protease YdiL (CAAX protease family)